MRKWILWLTTLLLLIPTTHVQAQPLTTYHEGSDDRIHAKNRWEVFSDTLEGDVFCSDDGIYIVQDKQEHFIETSSKVLHYLVIEDVDQDGVRDIVVFMDSQDHFDNLAILSVGKKEQITSRAITFERYSEVLGDVDINNKILSLNKAHENQFFVIVDHQILCLDTALNEVYQIQDQDNIWRIVSIGDMNQDGQEDYVYTCQRGAIVAFDGTNGKKLYDTTLLDPIRVARPYDDIRCPTALNTWDVVVDEEHLYVSGEDGFLYIIDKMKGQVIYQYDLELYQEKSLEDTLSANNIGYNENYTLSSFPTGLWNPYFDGIRLLKLDDHRLLIYAFFGSDQWQQQTQSDMFQIPERYHAPKLLVYDIEKQQVIQRITVENYDLKSSEILVDTDQEHLSVQVLSRLSDRGVLLSRYDLEDGSLLEAKEIPLLSQDKEDVSFYLDQREDGYLLSRKDHYVLKADLDWKNVSALTSFLVPRCLYHDDDQMILAYDQGSQTKKIIAYHQQDILWEIQLPETLSSSYFKQLYLEEDYLYGLIDIEEDKTTSSYIACYDIKTGKNLLLTRCIIDQMYDQQGRRYPVYAHGESLALQKDLNQDGYRDFLMDHYLISGKDGQLLAQNEAYFDAGRSLPVGDVNQDGIVDYAVAFDQEIRLYTSRLYQEGQWLTIDYVKSSSVYSYAGNLQNKEMAITVSDINQDGIDEIVINAKNTQGQLIYTVLNGKDLTRLYDLMEEGVYDWGEKFYFSTIDLNQDGWHEILYRSPFGEEIILDGQTGKSWFYLNAPADEHPKSMTVEPVMMNIMSEEEACMPVAVDDMNQDGYKDMAYFSNGSVDERYGLVFTILNGQTGESISKTMVSQQYYGEGKQIIKQLDASLWILSTSKVSWLYDIKEETILASFQQGIADGFYLDETTLLALDHQQHLSLLNISHDFKVEGLQEQVSKKIQFHVVKPEKGYVNVWDQGELCAILEDDQGSLYLKEGKHTLAFEFCNEQGKSIFVEKHIVVKNRSITPYLLYSVTLIVMAMMLYLAFYQKINPYLPFKKGGESNGK